MEPKKTPKADLERSRGIFFQIGFILTLLLVYGAFEWSQAEITLSDLGDLEAEEVEQEMVQITQQEPPPPPPPPQQQVLEVDNIVEDDVEIEEELEIKDQSIDDETEIEFIEIEEEEEEEEAPIYVSVQKMPEFPGGEIALRKHIAQNVKYPAIARENDIQGTVYLRFVVTHKGTVEKVTVIRGVDPLLDKEAIRVVKDLPKWSPGEQQGKKVNVWYTVPIKFALQ